MDASKNWEAVELGFFVCSMSSNTFSVYCVCKVDSSKPVLWLKSVGQKKKKDMNVMKGLRGKWEGEQG